MEFEDLKARAAAAGFGLSEFLRTTALGEPPASVPPLNQEAFAHFVRIGGNLNQLAHHLNSGVAVPFAGPLPDLNALTGLLLAVRREILPNNDRRRRRR